MDKPFVGWDKNYSDNYDQIFKKSVWRKIKEFLDKTLYEIFIKDIQA